MDPRSAARLEHARAVPVLVWQFVEPVSSGPLGGRVGAWGLVGQRHRPLDYARTAT